MLQRSLLLLAVLALATGPGIAQEDASPDPQAEVTTAETTADESPDNEPAETNNKTVATDDEPLTELPDPVSPVFNRLNGKIERVGPDTYLLLDAEGNPQPVLNMNIEQFIRAWKGEQVNRGQSEGPSNQFTLNECRLVGSLEGNHAALSAVFTVTLHTNKTIDVPLGLAGTLLRKLPVAPRGQQGRYVRYDADEGGYFVTLNGKPDETVRVELDLMVPVRRDGTRATMRLLAPRATKGSLVLVSKSAIQSVVASEGVVLSTNTLVAGGVRIEAEGVAGEFSLSWVDRPTTSDTQESVLTASSEVLVSIDGRDVRNSARLTVDGFGQSFREFTVRLPPGARHVPTGLSPPIESVEVVNDSSSTGEEAGNNPAPGTVLRVTLSADQSDPVVLDLQTIEPLHRTSDGISLELSGFEVVGAVPQEGEVGIQVDDGWQLRWEPRDSVQLIHPTELDFSWASPDAMPDKLAAALRFSRQPWLLPVQIVPREERVLATPKYQLTINPGEALLRMEVDYRIEGGRSLPALFMPRFALAGWDHLQTTTRNMEGAQEVEQQEDFFGFETAYATSRQPRVVLEFRRALPPRAKGSIVLPLPHPNLESVTLNSSDVIINADTSLQITPDGSGSVGLAPLPIEDADDASSGGPPGQQFHYRGVYPPFIFAAKQAPRPRRILINSESQVNLSPDQVSVIQDIDFDVRHQPVSTLVFAASSKLKNLELELLPAAGSNTDDLGTKLEIPKLLADGASVAAALPERRVPLPHPRLGKFRVQARYLLEPITSSDGTYFLPLLSVPGCEFGGHSLQLDSSLGIAIEPVLASQWQTTADGSVMPELNTYFSKQQVNVLPLTASGQSNTPTTLKIEKVWVQTWLTKRATQTRAVFQFRGGEEQVHIALPADIPPGEQFDLTLDGNPISSWHRVAGDIQVTLPSQPAPTERTLELRYRVPSSLGWTNSLAPGRPQLMGDATGAESMYWQIVVPVEYQQIRAGASFVAASHNEWANGDWRSISDLDAPDIEQWIGASAGELRPTRGEHAFLFRSWPEANLQVTLVRRELLVLAASASVLAVCLALAYIPWLRQPPAMMCGFAALVAAGLAAPQLAASLAPLGFFGLICGLLMWVLVVMYSPKPTASSPSKPAAGSRPEPSGSHRPATFIPMGSEPVSTGAATVSVELTDSNA